MIETIVNDPQSQLQQSYDDDLERRVKSFLYEQQQDLLTDLEVHADRGSIVVAGIVESNSDKEKCLSCCQRVAGVIKLIDEIEIAYGSVQVKDEG